MFKSRRILGNPKLGNPTNPKPEHSSLYTLHPTPFTPYTLHHRSSLTPWNFVIFLRVHPALSKDAVFLDTLGFCQLFYGYILPLNTDAVFVNTFEEFVNILQGASCP